MFFLLFDYAFRAFQITAFVDFNLNMATPEDSSQSPESRRQYLTPGTMSKLSNFQLRWLDTQGRELGRSSAEILHDILSEWFTRHPPTTNEDVVSIETARAALDEFIASHHAEFLPVEFSE